MIKKFILGEIGTLLSSSTIGIFLEKTLSQSFNLKSVYSQTDSATGDSGDCSNVVFGADAIALLAPYGFAVSQFDRLLIIIHSVFTYLQKSE